jgi:hypothetical protein
MDMDIPQYVSPVKAKKSSNITILKKGKRYYEMPVKISYTRII